MSEYYDGDACLKAIESADLGEGFHLGNVIKYLWRAGRKGDVFSDLQKAEDYLNRWLEVYERNENDALVVALRAAIRSFRTYADSMRPTSPFTSDGNQPEAKPPIGRDIRTDPLPGDRFKMVNVPHIKFSVVTSVSDGEVVIKHEGTDPEFRFARKFWKNNLGFYDVQLADAPKPYPDITDEICEEAIAKKRDIRKDPRVGDRFQMDKGQDWYEIIGVDEQFVSYRNRSNWSDGGLISLGAWKLWQLNDVKLAEESQ